MELESVQQSYNQDHIDDAPHQQSINSSSSDICDIFGDPEIPFRLGDHYQAEIPPLVTGSDSLLSSKIQTKVKLTSSDYCNFFTGLDIPLMWISGESLETKGKGEPCDMSRIDAQAKPECVGEVHMCASDEVSELKGDPSGITLDDALRFVVSENSSLQQAVRNEKHGKSKGKRYYLVPGVLGEEWSDVEEASFLLGLYIFGKNLVQVKKFVNSKKMGDILSFYYGRFYRSKEYCRWSECRKIRSRKCAFGHRIFTGSRQQELLSRLLPHLSAESQKTLLEVSKAFGEGKMSLEEYVIFLKCLIGMSKFIEAVGIGRGKEDLTGISGESSKAGQILNGRPDVPIGKACSSLTHEEIVKLLTGDYRLSKARSRDLFWEAVWPRLLARGWNSEQPKNRGYVADSNYLVFLAPGVKKFSRRRLVKGTHYYDSVTDVLSKVASDPALLELEGEGYTGNRSKEYEPTNMVEVHEEDVSKQPRHCYLQPRPSNHHKDVLKITIVDTSLNTGEKPKIKELRSLPFESLKTSESRSHSEESEDEVSEDPTDESNPSEKESYQKDQTDFTMARINRRDKGICSVLKECEVSSSNGPILDTSSDSGDLSQESNENHISKVPNDKHPRKGAKSQRLKPRNVDYMAPVTKRRRRLKACSRAEPSRSTLSFSMVSGFKKERDSCCSDFPDSGETGTSEVVPFHEKGSFTNSLCNGSPISESILSSGQEVHHKKPPARTLIDLNLPHVPTDLGIDKPLMLEMTGSQVDSTKEQLDNSTGRKASMDPINTQQEPTLNPRRQSTRNRPLTTRALEAFACGFLSTKSKRSRKSTEENLQSSPSRRVRGRAASSKVEDANDGFSGKKEMLSQFHMEAPVSGP